MEQVTFLSKQETKIITNYANPDDLGLLGLPGQAALASLVAELTKYWTLKNTGILQVTPESVMTSIENGLAYALYDDNFSMAIFLRLLPLADTNLSTVEVFELGTVVKNISSQLKKQRLLPLLGEKLIADLRGQSKLVISTARDPKVIATLLQFGFQIVKWTDFLPLQALTCDPGCNPELDGAYQSCTSDGITCRACSTNPIPETRKDSCYLLVNDLKLAQKWIYDIVSNPIFQQENGQFDALKFRNYLGLKV